MPQVASAVRRFLPGNHTPGRLSRLWLQISNPSSHTAGCTVVRVLRQEEPLVEAPAAPRSPPQGWSRPSFPQPPGPKAKAGLASSLKRPHSSPLGGTPLPRPERGEVRHEPLPLAPEARCPTGVDRPAQSWVVGSIMVDVPEREKGLHPLGEERKSQWALVFRSPFCTIPERRTGAAALARGRGADLLKYLPSIASFKDRDRSPRSFSWKPCPSAG